MDHRLWEQILAFDFDQPVSEYGFSTRLAFENSWTINFTADAILEYRKFMYLAATDGKMVSPSPIVDTVWHQHLIFTQSYDSLCSILGKKIEHVPSTHDPKQANVFKDAEQRTKQLYELAFGPQPPELWTHKTMVDTLDLEMAEWSIRKIIWAGILAFVLLLIPVSFLLRPVFTDIDGSTFLLIFAAAAVVAFVGLRQYNDLQSLRIGEMLSSRRLIAKLTPEEVIFMESNQLQEIIHGRVNGLVIDETLKVSDDRKLSVAKDKPSADAFSATIIGTISEIQTVFYRNLVGRLMQKPVFRQIPKSAAAINEHFKKSKIFARYFVINYVVLLAVLLIGFSRFAVGIIREKPVGYLILLLIVSIIMAIRHLNVESNFLIRQCIPNLFRNILKFPVNADAPDWSYFLLGNAIMAATFLPLLSDARNRPGDPSGWGFWGNSGSCGSSCSSSCGSSCGGGGCGGCGGD